MKKLYFITGSQDLYGEETLKQVAQDTKEMARFLNEKLQGVAGVEWKPVVINSESCIALMEEASADKDCVGVIAWMHTFSPAKMWIKGLQILRKPLCHLHTQANERLPYESIDMDFMNLNQAAHGDREFGFICTRLNVKRQIVVGYYQNEKVLAQLRQFAEVARALDFSRKLKVAMFGSNMRQVAVTDGDRVESQIRFGWEVNYYGIGDLVALAKAVTETQIAEKIKEYRVAYDWRTDNLAAVQEQARYEIALDRFVAQHGIGAYTDTFEDLYGLAQLPGLATQRMQGKGIGFGAEGDYKTSALNAVLWKMAEGRKGATGFMEDYTYDLADGYVLGAHMLEVSPAFAATKPAVEVHPLGIGGKADPARLTFGGVQGGGVAVCMIDLGDRFRLVCANIELIAQPKPMPKLPVAQIMWVLKPDFERGARGWLEAGGGHHTVVSTALTADDIRLFAKFTDTELVVIG
jgi:L-arabinose isomerase